MGKFKYNKEIYHHKITMIHVVEACCFGALITTFVQSPFA